MEIEDMPRFAVLLGSLEAAYRTRLKEDTIGVYFRGLMDLPWLEVVNAVGKAVKTSPKMPTIAVIRGLVSQGRVDPTHQFRGSYPPDIATQRRAYGLPVTSEDHAEYARGEHREPSTSAQAKLAILRDVAARDMVGEYAVGGARARGSLCAGRGRVAAWMTELADDIEAGRPAGGGLFADVLASAMRREPGEEG